MHERPTRQNDTLIAQLREDLLDSLDEAFDLEMEDRLVEDARRPGELASSRMGYFRELLRLQTELIKLQDWVVHSRQRMVILFEGRDAAGKGGVIKRIARRLNCIDHLRSQVPYHEVPHPNIELPARVRHPD